MSNIINMAWTDREVVIDKIEQIIEEFRVKLSTELYELAKNIDGDDLNKATGERESTQTIGDTYRYLRKKYATFGSRFGSSYGNNFVPKEIYMLSFVEVLEILEKNGQIDREEVRKLVIGKI